MSLTYNNLIEEIGRFLGYSDQATGSGSIASNSQWSRDVGRIRDKGLKGFYDPPIVPPYREKHQWSFTTPTLTYQIASGKHTLDLPENFVDFPTHIFYEPGTNELYPPMRNVGVSEVMRRLSHSNDPGRPSAFGVRVKAAQEIHVTQWELVFHPVSDGDYTMKAPTKINPIIPANDSNDNELPLGGQPHELVIVEACLAEAERFDESRGSIAHQQRFLELLPAAISHDLQVSGPRNLGYHGDPGHEDWRDMAWGGSESNPMLTYGGQVWND